MGMTYTEGTLTGPTGKQAVVRFLVDSGAVYTLVPHDVWKALDLVPKRTVTFSLADGTPINLTVSECHITLPQGDGHTPVILGEPGDEALLGTVTLEELGLVLHPFKRTLEQCACSSPDGAPRCEPVSRRFLCARANALRLPRRSYLPAFPFRRKSQPPL